MNSASANSASNSGPTSQSEPKKPLSESAYLTQQINDASKAIARVKQQLMADLASGVDPKLWMNVHPWTTLAGALVAGFAAAAAVVPSKEQQALRRLAEIERALMPKPADVTSPVDGDGVKGRRKPTFLSGLATEILGAVKPAILSMLTAGITAQAAKPTPEEIHNAAHGDTPPADAPGADAAGAI